MERITEEQARMSKHLKSPRRLHRRIMRRLLFYLGILGPGLIAVLTRQGKPMLFYTSIGPRLPEQWAALPEDDDLVKWKKHPANPLLTEALHGGVKVHEWRDPYVFDHAGRIMRQLARKEPLKYVRLELAALGDRSGPLGMIAALADMVEGDKGSLKRPEM